MLRVALISSTRNTVLSKISGRTYTLSKIVISSDDGGWSRKLPRPLFVNRSAHASREAGKPLAGGPAFPTCMRPGSGGSLAVRIENGTEGPFEMGMLNEKGARIRRIPGRSHREWDGRPIRDGNAERKGARIRRILGRSHREWDEGPFSMGMLNEKS